MSWLRVLPVLFAVTALGCEKRSLEPDGGTGFITTGTGGNAAVDAGHDSFTVTEQWQLCGNGRIDPGEVCDDGNLNPGDGCTRLCQLECYESCGGCGYWQPCNSSGCGNGRIDPGEECDDGGTYGGDGCSLTCTLESGWRCPVAGQGCAPICGDKRAIGLETCDDGNTIAGDGCSEICTIEPTTARCGDGVVQGSEECDFGVYNADDVYGACTTTCRYGLRCGDGVVTPGVEECDFGSDQNRAHYGAAGGCAPTCTFPHFCGDGLVDVENGEQCDLSAANGMAGVPCTANCLICVDCGP